MTLGTTKEFMFLTTFGTTENMLAFRPTSDKPQIHILQVDYVFSNQYT